MEDVPDSRRMARFITVVAFVDNHSCHTRCGSVSGIILKKAKGVGGFGYDPVFYIPDMKKTFAQMSQPEKALISHRGKAVRKMVQFLSDYSPSPSNTQTEKETA